MSESYARAALAGEVERVRAAIEGSRNDTLHLAAFRLGQLVSGGELPVQEVADALEDAARSTGLAAPEARATIWSGLRGGSARPRAGGTAGGELAYLTGSNGAGRRTFREWAGVDLPTVLPTVQPAVQDDDELAWIKSVTIPASKLHELTPPPPLVRSVLFRDSIAWLYGAPGSGKSFIALDIAGCVATGEPWQGFPTTRGAVLYVAGEGASGLWPRVNAWQKSMGVEMAGVDIVRVAIQAANERTWSELMALAGQSGAVLVVIDTQARSTVGLDENSAKDMGLFVHALERMRQTTGACVLVVHHAGKAGETMRGSGALDGAASTVIKISRSENVLDVECLKQKDAPEFDQLRLRMTPFEGSIVVSTTLNRGPSIDSSPVAARMLTYWWTTFEGDWTTVPMICESTGVARSVFYHHAKALERAGVLAREGDPPRTRYRLLRNPSYLLSNDCTTVVRPAADIDGTVLSNCPPPLYRGGQLDTTVPCLGAENSEDEGVS